MIMDSAFRAIVDGNFELLKEIISGNENDLNYRNDSEWTILHAAVSVNRLDMVKYLLHLQSIPINAQCCEGRTCLLLACEHEHTKPEIVEYLLEAGANVNLPNNDSITPLHAACRNGNTEIVSILLKYDANINANDSNGYAPIHCVALSNSTQTLRLLQLNNELDLNATDLDGCSALMLATDVGNTEVAQELLRFEANVNLIGRDTTTLHLSVVTQQIELFEVIWSKIDFEILEELAYRNNLLKLMIKYGWFFPDRLEIFLNVLSHPNISVLLTPEAKILETFFYRIRFVKDVYEVNVHAVLTKLLESDIKVTPSDIRAFLQFFYKHKFRYDFLELLIEKGHTNFDTKELITFAVDLFPNIVPTLLSYCIRVNPLDIFQHFTETIRVNENMLKLLMLILRLCTPNIVLKNNCKIHVMMFSFAESVLQSDNNDMIDAYNNAICALRLKNVPSLRELARDEIRKYFASFCMDTWNYLKFVRQLTLPKDIVDLIQCKMAVNCI